MDTSIENRFCLNTATIKSTPLEQQIALAANAGFERIGLWHDDVANATSRGATLEEIAALLQNAGLRVEEFCFLGGWQEADEAGFARAVEDTRRLCRLASALGCDLLIAVPAAGSGSLSTAPQRFRRLCDVAAEYNVRIALEFPGTAAEVMDLRTAWRLVSSARSDHGGLVIDTFHFFLGGSNLEDLAAIPREKIFLVHVSDAMDVSPEKLRAFHDYRTFPGCGTLNYAPLFRELDRLGYDGALSLEVWNQEMLRADPKEVAREGFESLLRLSRALAAAEGSQTERTTAEGIVRTS